MSAMKAKMLFVVLAAAPIALNADWYDSLLKKKDAEPASVNGGRGATVLPGGASLKPYDARRMYVLCDPLLRAPATIYRLEPGWDAMGCIRWNAAARKNQYTASIIFCNPAEHMVVQEQAPFSEEQQLLNMAGAEWQDPNLMAQKLANTINSGIVVPGLANFVARGGRFTDDVPPKTRQRAEIGASTMKAPGVSHRVFKVECFFECTYGGVPCEAKYEFVSLYYITQPMPKLPAIGWSYDYDVRLTVAPPGKLAEAARAGGRMIAGAFVNHAWQVACDRMMLAIATGKMIGANEGYALMKQSQQEFQRTQEKINIARSEMIREVKTVDNPFSPGEKFERPAFFDHSWLNASQDALLLSDRNLEPNTMRGLIEMGDWRPVD